MIQKERVKCLNEESPGKGEYVLYWMQASQRVEYNYALKYATLKANHLNKPVVAFFGITSNFQKRIKDIILLCLKGCGK